MSYYPLHVGDKWHYNVESQTFDTDSIPRNYQALWEVMSDTLMSNGKKYFKIKREHLYEQISFERIDSNTGKIFGYHLLRKDEFIIGDLRIPIDKWIDSTNHNSFPLIQFLHESDSMMFITSSERELRDAKRYFVSGGMYGYYYLSNKVGISRYHFEFDFGYQNWILFFATINGTTYGDSTLVGVNDKQTKTPMNFSLSQNYPNPFNPTTTISYKIPLSRGARGVLSNVTLKVYDVLGKEVSTLINKQQNSGSYKVNFDATNLSSGVYYYQLRSGEFVETKKMIILK